MVYNYSQLLPSATIEVVYKITTPDKMIGTFWWFASNIMGRGTIKTGYKQLIIH